MVEAWGWVDPHTHMDTRPYEDFEAMGIAGIRDILTLAHDPLRMCHACVLLDHFYRLTTLEVKRGKENGVRVHVALGIHPRAIPEEVEVVIKALPKLLLHPSAVAVGEVGLESGSMKEVEVFRGMLGLVGEFPAIVHTPRENKEEITEKSIGIVEDMGVKADKILIDHVNAATIGDVLSSGAYAGLTVQPGKLSLGDLAGILEGLGGDELARVVVNSDLGSSPSDPLAVARAAHYLLKIGVDLGVVRQVCGENARRLFVLSTQRSLKPKVSGSFDGVETVNKSSVPNPKGLRTVSLTAEVTRSLRSRDTAVKSPISRDDDSRNRLEG